MSQHRHYFSCLIITCIASLVQLPSVLAQPLIDAGDSQVRHHLQVLADARLINLPLTSWPLMWSSVDQALAGVETSGLTPAQLNAYRFLRHELTREQKRITQGAQLSVSSSHYGLIDFATSSRERLLSSTYASFNGSRWAGRLQVSLVGDAIDEQRYRLDGSYVAAIAGNWVFGVGAIDRWWGPSWQSSLILSNSARPAPGIFVKRASNEAFDLPVLEWLGPWGLETFFNQLEGSRATSHAKLFGMRMSFKPAPAVEIGLSRTAQWGGEGRPEDWVSFRRMMLGMSNRGADGIAQDGSNEPANQLAGYDWRISHSFAGVGAAFYGQLIGEDEANYQPYKFLGLAGVEASFSHGLSQSRLALEVSNTTMEFEDDGTPNVAYEHPRYPSGYRYRGRPIGASMDNDSEFVVLKGFHYFANAHSLNWTIGTGNINADGTSQAPPGGNVFASQKVDLNYAAVSYSLPLTRRSELTVGAQYYSEPLSLRTEDIESGVNVTYTQRLD